MAQGAATSIEDGVFLAKCLEAVMQAQLSLPEAIRIYESGRMPKASYKQQVSYLNGLLWHLPDGAASKARDRAMQPELNGSTVMRSPNLYGDPRTVLECYGYDVEAHAADEIATFLNNGQPLRDAATTVTREQADSKFLAAAAFGSDLAKYSIEIVNWCLPEDHQLKIHPRL